MNILQMPTPELVMYLFILNIKYIRIELNPSRVFIPVNEVNSRLYFLGLLSWLHAVPPPSPGHQGEAPARARASGQDPCSTV